MFFHWAPMDFTFIVLFGQRVCILQICAPDSPFSSEQSCHNQTDPLPGFDLLYAFVIVRLGRRDLVWINVTANPTAEWVARQITEAFPWDEAPRYLMAS